MKKTILLLLTVFSAVMAQAQAPDTVEHRCRRYYYSQWYDTCECCYSGAPGSALASMYGLRMTQNSWVEFALPDSTSEEMEVLGVALMVNENDPTDPRHWRDTNYGPEYVYVAYYDSANNTMIGLDTARWDTLVPKVMKLRLTDTPEYYYHSDQYPDGVLYCSVYEAYFEKPVTVNGEFYLICTCHGCKHCESPWDHMTEHRPVIYQQVEGFTTTPCRAHGVAMNNYLNRAWYRLSRNSWGPLFPIVAEQNEVTVHSADSAMGHVVGGGLYRDSAVAVLTAVPEHGFKFSHWNDGDSTNPRQVVVTCDTAFTAYFDTLPTYMVTLLSNSDTLGHTVGGGRYFEGDRAVIKAVPREGVGRFVRWSDGVTANPRNVIVMQDTTFKAYFAYDPVGISEVSGGQGTFTLKPNPARGKVEVRLSREAEAGTVLRLRDAAGHEVVSREVAAGTKRLTVDLDALPKGAYFVTLATPEGSATQKLVVE